MTMAENPTSRDAGAASPVVKPFPPRPDAATPGDAAASAPEAARPAGRKQRIIGVLVLAVLAGAGYWGHGWWTEGRFLVRTDDAYVQADIAAVSAKIQGYIDRVEVSENQRVAASDVIARLDDGDFRIALQSAESTVATQAATLLRIAAQTDAARAILRQTEAQKAAAGAILRNSERTAERLRGLVVSKAAPQARLDDAEAAHDQARAGLAGAEAEIASAEANVAVLQARHTEAASQMRALKLGVDQARRNLDLTVLRAPYAGVVANLAIEPGDLVSPGQRLAAVVPVERLYVEANYKETQLAGIAPGALAHVRLDALPGQVFEGHVRSIAPATGALFSVLPPQNATGNFTKIVQRVPVRISLPAEALATGALHAGLSAVVEVDSRTPAAR